MKILSKNQYEGIVSEKILLNEAFCPSQTGAGLAICYSLLANSSLSNATVQLKAEHEEIGVPLAWEKEFSRDLFYSYYPSLEIFFKGYDVEEFGDWRISAQYQDVSVLIIGYRNSRVVYVSYQVEKTLNLIPLLSTVETDTYRYNRFDPQIIGVLKNDFKMTEKRAVLTIEKLMTHPDIYGEFVQVLTDGFKSHDLSVSVEGYTAEQLKSSFPLSILGAYNYLIYLREHPEEALTDLKNGLPRR